MYVCDDTMLAAVEPSQNKFKGENSHWKDAQLL